MTPEPDLLDYLLMGVFAVLGIALVVVVLVA